MTLRQLINTVMDTDLTFIDTIVTGVPWETVGIVGGLALAAVILTTWIDASP